MISVAFFGSHPLGEACLRRLHDSEDVRLEVVVTYPSGYDSWWDGSVRDLAEEYGCPILDIEEEDRLREYAVEYLLCVYYPNILDETLLAHPENGAINLHQAELPRYRGSNVFSHAIMNARDDDHWKHGTTLHFMAPTVDAGDVIDRQFVPITDDDTARTLYERTEYASLELFEETLPAIVSGEVHEMRTPQEGFDGPRYFYTKDSLDERKQIPRENFETPADEAAVYDRIRALDFPPFEPAYTRLNGERIYLTKNSYAGGRPSSSP